MRLVVLSPLHRSGCSVVTTMLAQALALTQDMKTVVTYTDPDRTLPVYLGLRDSLTDKTRSISQIVKLIEAHAISAEELNEFTIKVAPNFYVMDTVSEIITPEEALMAQKHVFTNIQADMVICDSNQALDDDDLQSLLDVCDAICVVLNPDTISVEACQTWMNSEYWPKNKPCMLVLNRFDENIVGLRLFAKHCHIETKNVCKLHYNPFITKSCNEDFLVDIVPYAYEKDVRVLNLRTDLYELMSWCMNTCGHKLRWNK